MPVQLGKIWKQAGAELESCLSLEKNKLGLSCTKLKLGLVKVVDEVTLIVNSVEVEIEVIVELSLLVLPGGWVEEKKTKLMLYSTQL